MASLGHAKAAPPLYSPCIQCHNALVDAKSGRSIDLNEIDKLNGAWSESNESLRFRNRQFAECRFKFTGNQWQWSDLYFMGGCLFPFWSVNEMEQNQEQAKRDGKRSAVERLYLGLVIYTHVPLPKLNELRSINLQIIVQTVEEAHTSISSIPDTD